jgi:uncharacterized protein YcfJ
MADEQQDTAEGRPSALTDVRFSLLGALLGGVIGSVVLGSLVLTIVCALAGGILGAAVSRMNAGGRPPPNDPT